ncbi:MAG: hypothetical protein JXN64_03820 [Spirochaetes bacterium]|nr:hypothetical protein [Spirochaetota bacterium]
MLKKYIILFILLLSVFSCQDHDTIGKIIIEYDNNWTAIITQDKIQTHVNGSGKQQFVYKNPDFLGVSATKQDTSSNRLTLYIYEDGRIVAADFTDEPDGTVSIEYEFPF